MNISSRFVSVVSGSLVVASLLVAAPAFAQSTGQQGTPGKWGPGPAHVPGVFGTVSVVSGTTLTVTSQGFGPSSSSATPTTYMVDAGSATVMKNGASSSLSSVAVGDKVMVQGTVSGDSVTATTIRDGMPQGMGAGMRGSGKWGSATSTHSMMPKPAMPQGNGEPVIGGSITAVSGNTLTVTNKSNVTYSVDASSAFVSLKGATSSVSSISTGDSVIVQGTVNGTSIVASSVIDSGATPTSADSGNGSSAPKGAMGGFLGMVGGFFQHLFGFF